MGKKFTRSHRGTFKEMLDIYRDKKNQEKSYNEDMMNEVLLPALEERRQLAQEEEESKRFDVGMFNQRLQELKAIPQQIFNYQTYSKDKTSRFLHDQHEADLLLTRIKRNSEGSKEQKRAMFEFMQNDWYQQNHQRLTSLIMKQEMVCIGKKAEAISLPKPIGIGITKMQQFITGGLITSLHSLSRKEYGIKELKIIFSVRAHGGFTQHSDNVCNISSINLNNPKRSIIKCNSAPPGKINPKMIARRDQQLVQESHRLIEMAFFLDTIQKNLNLLFSKEDHVLRKIMESMKEKYAEDKIADIDFIERKKKSGEEFPTIPLPRDCFNISHISDDILCANRLYSIVDNLPGVIVIKVVANYENEEIEEIGSLEFLCGPTESLKLYGIQLEIPLFYLSDIITGIELALIAKFDGLLDGIPVEYILYDESCGGGASCDGFTCKTSAESSSLSVFEIKARGKHKTKNKKPKKQKTKKNKKTKKNNNV